MATKKCKHCQTEIDAKARVCPQCRGKLGTSATTGCLAFVFGGIALAIFGPIVCTAMLPDIPESASRQPSPPVTPRAQGSENSCEEYIELHGSKVWASELGKPEMWVLANHRINLWQYQGTPARPHMGRKMGEMLVGSRALILEKKVDHASLEAAMDYRVRSPLDGSVGWVHDVQVARTLYQRVKTFEPCTPPEALN